MVVIVDYGLGNVGSVRNMLKKLGVDSVISQDPAVIRGSSALILPGVGAFDEGMTNLRSRGLIDPLHEMVIERQTPILGICLGMQLFCRSSEEGTLPGLGWLNARTVRFRLPAPNPVGDLHPGVRVPHMGWNWIYPRGSDGLFGGFPSRPRFYFVHSYHVECDEPGDVLATSKYGYEFTSAVRRSNIVGTQFHPEKSHHFGIQTLRNFLEGASRC